MSMVSQRFLQSGRDLPEELEVARKEIEALAKSYGLDFFDTVFVMCSYEEINMLASYEGFPTRYPHWRFGMDFLKMQKSYEFGLSKIYEMVINTDPSYAYLMDCNLVVDQKLVMAHVYGHVDFFKNNAWFSKTNRKMLDQMANHATRVRRIMDQQGVNEVERFIERCMSIDNLIDPHSPFIVRDRPVQPSEHPSGEVGKLPAKDYMEPFINPPEFLEAQRQKKSDERERLSRFPSEPTRDVLSFLIQHAPLKNWQREILQIIRDEAYYFAPQGQTKIMNEGWATYWHTKMMTEHILSDAEVIDYADHHSGTVATQPGQLNPYALGVLLWRHIEERWNKGRFGKEWMECDDPRIRDAWDTEAGLGREKIFQVRKTHNDVSFLETFLTEDFVRQHGMFTTHYEPRTKQWIIDSSEFQAVKRQLLDMVASRGSPRLFITNANAFNRGELMLAHEYSGADLLLGEAERVMENLALIWGRPVHLQTRLEDRPITLTHDGESLDRTHGHHSESAGTTEGAA